ncbi:hypothetical protein ACVWYF_002379 [Hymenobacter sp. UYAg731]
MFFRQKNPVILQWSFCSNLIARAGPTALGSPTGCRKPVLVRNANWP